MKKLIITTMVLGGVILFASCQQQQQQQDQPAPAPVLPIKK